IVVAHRLSTVRSLDRLLVLDRGRVIEEGDHDALIRIEGGVYRRLFERQALELAKGLIEQTGGYGIDRLGSRLAAGADGHAQPLVPDTVAK
ncbi:ABC transporter ATP-binding protein, partial [Burkholderia gladioli]